MDNVTKRGRLQQVLAIAVMLVIWSVIVSKGYTDISLLLVEEPDDFWRALVKYFLSNMAGGADD
jgi:hypothetical protein